MSLPRLECIAAAGVMRLFGPVPSPATPFDYERVLRPVYGLSYSVAQSGLAQRATRPSERVWRTISRPQPRLRPGPARGARGAAIGAGESRRRSGASTACCTPTSTPTSPPTAIAASGVDAATELGERLGVGDVHADHRSHPPRRTRRGRRRLGAARRRLAPQHRQLDLRLRLPSPRHAARPLLAGDRHLARGRRAAAPGAPARRPSARAARRRGPAQRSRRDLRNQRRLLALAGAPITTGDLRLASASGRLQPLGDDRADLGARVLLEVVTGVLDLSRCREVEPLRDLFADRERQRRVGVGPEQQLSAARPRGVLRRPVCPPPRPGHRARSGGSAGRPAPPPSTPRSGTGPRRRRSPRRPGPPCSPALTRKPTGRSSLRATKSRNLSQFSLIRWCPVKGPVSMIDDPREALRVLDRQPQADRPAPVVDDSGRVADVELLEQRRHQLDVAVVRVPGDVGGLVGAAEAGVVGGDAAVARRRGPAGSPCARGTTRSARRGRRRPASPPPRRGRRAAARRPRGSATRTGSRAAPARASSGVRTTSPALIGREVYVRQTRNQDFPLCPINFLLPCRTASELTQSTK